MLLLYFLFLLSTIRWRMNGEGAMAPKLVKHCATIMELLQTIQ